LINTLHPQKIPTMDSNYTVEKGTVEIYRIRTKSSGWADITIDANGSKGRISIASDYGRWSNYWGACGDSFKTFLAKVNMEYVADKFDEDRWFDHEATLLSYKREIIELRRDYTLSAKTSRDLWDELKTLDYCTREEEFCMELARCNELMMFFNHCPEIVRDVSPIFKMFWKEIWPILLGEFKNEELTQHT